MKKIFLCVCIMAFAVPVFADVQMISHEDAVQIGIVTDILWKESPINEDDSKKLLEIVRYPHEDVASYALVAAITRNPDNLQEILTTAAGQKYNRKKIADYILKIGKADVIQTIR